MEDTKKIKLQKAIDVKNLAFADKKENLHILIAKNETKIEKSFWKTLGISAGSIRFAKPEALSLLGLYAGAVNPFAIANDTEKKVKYIILDKNMMEHEYFAFHPMDNKATVEISRVDFFKFMESYQREVKVIKLDEKEGGEQPEKNEENQKKGEEKKKTEEKDEEKRDEEGTKLKLMVKKSVCLPEWYSELITKSEILEYYDISGCYIIRPWGYFIWEQVQAFFDQLIKQVRKENE